MNLASIAYGVSSPARARPAVFRPYRALEQHRLHRASGKIHAKPTLVAELLQIPPWDRPITFYETSRLLAKTPPSPDIQFPPLHSNIFIDIVDYGELSPHPEGSHILFTITILFNTDIEGISIPYHALTGVGFTIGDGFHFSIHQFRPAS